MPKYTIQTTAMLRRTYEVEAATEDEAIDKLNEGSVEPLHEEEVNEDVDDVTELAPKAA